MGVENSQLDILIKLYADITGGKLTEEQIARLKTELGSLGTAGAKAGTGMVQGLGHARRELREVGMISHEVGMAIEGNLGPRQLLGFTRAISGLIPQVGEVVAQMGPALLPIAGVLAIAGAAWHKYSEDAKKQLEEVEKAVQEHAKRIEELLKQRRDALLELKGGEEGAADDEKYRAALAKSAQDRDAANAALASAKSALKPFNQGQKTDAEYEETPLAVADLKKMIAGEGREFWEKNYPKVYATIQQALSADEGAQQSQHIVEGDLKKWVEQRAAGLEAERVLREQERANAADEQKWKDEIARNRAIGELPANQPETPGGALKAGLTEPQAHRETAQAEIGRLTADIVAVTVAEKAFRTAGYNEKSKQLRELHDKEVKLRTELAHAQSETETKQILADSKEAVERTKKIRTAQLDQLKGDLGAPGNQSYAKQNALFSQIAGLEIQATPEKFTEIQNQLEKHQAELAKKYPVEAAAAAARAATVGQRAKPTLTPEEQRRLKDIARDVLYEQHTGAPSPYRTGVETMGSPLAADDNPDSSPLRDTDQKPLAPPGTNQPLGDRPGGLLEPATGAEPSAAPVAATPAAPQPLQFNTLETVLGTYFTENMQALQAVIGMVQDNAKQIQTVAKQAQNAKGVI